MSMDGFTLSQLRKELEQRLIGGRIDRVFQPSKLTLVIWIRSGSENLCLEIAATPDNPRISLVETPPENPAVPPSFCMLLRKHLEDGRIAGIEQHGMDRVLTLSIDVRGEHAAIVTKNLVIELTGKNSNVVFTDGTMIIDSLRRIGLLTSRVRQILPGLVYQYPPAPARLNLLTQPLSLLRECLEQAPGTLVKAIIGCADGIGPVTAAEMIWRAGLPKDIVADQLDQTDYTALIDAVESMVTPIQEDRLQPTVISEGQRLIGIAPFVLTHLAGKPCRTFPTMNQAAIYAAGLKGKPSLPEQDLLKRILHTEIAKLERKQTALTGEVDESDQADRYRNFADLLMSNLHLLKPHAASASVPDLFSDDPETASPVEIPLDVTLDSVGNAQAYYAKYNKLKRARQTRIEQLTLCRSDISYLESVLVSVEQSPGMAELAEIREELISGGWIQASGKKRRPVSRPAEPLTVKLPNGEEIIIGRNNRQNDLVTFKVGRSDDIWMHTKEIPGSHVILRGQGGAPSSEGLRTAAELAAWFSKARQSGNVPVDYTRRKHVRKPSGAKPGFVIYDHQTTLVVTPREEIVNQILQENKK